MKGAPSPGGMRATPLGLALLATILAPAVQAQGDFCPLDFMATADGPGEVRFHWTGFGGADGYQVVGHQGSANDSAVSPVLSGDARDFTATGLAAGSYQFHVVAYHSGTVVASSCERSVDVQATQVPFFPSAAAMGLAGAGAAGAVLLALARRR